MSLGIIYVEFPKVRDTFVRVRIRGLRVYIGVSLFWEITI